MPTIVGILTFMSRINSILGLSEPKKSWISWYFYTYEHLKFLAQLSWAWKKFYNLGAWIAGTTFDWNQFLCSQAFLSLWSYTVILITVCSNSMKSVFCPLSELPQWGDTKEFHCIPISFYWEIYFSQNFSQNSTVSWTVWESDKALDYQF